MFTCASHTRFSRARASANPGADVSIQANTHASAVFDRIGDGLDVDERAQFLPRLQIVARPKDEIELLHERIAEMHAGGLPFVRVFVPSGYLAKAFKIAMRGLAPAVSKVETGESRKEFLEWLRRAHDRRLVQIVSRLQRFIRRTTHMDLGCFRGPKLVTIQEWRGHQMVERALFIGSAISFLCGDFVL